MATQDVEGGIGPTGDVVDFVIEIDNPLGVITPFGTLAWSNTGDIVLGADVLFGVISPTGNLITVAPVQCFPTLYTCIIAVTPVYVCVGICETPLVIVTPSVDVAGVIIPIGTLVVEGGTCIPVSLGAYADFDVVAPELIDFTWFKQSGFSPVIFDDNRLFDSDGFTPTHTIGVPTGHIGDASPILPDDYSVSAIVYTGAQGSGGGAPNLGVGVIGRVPLDAAFNQTNGVYWGWRPNGNAFKLSIVTGGDPFTPTISASDSEPDTGYHGQYIIMTLRFTGDLIEGLVNGVVKCSLTNSTYDPGGRIGVITPWQSGSAAWIQGPLIVRDSDGAIVLSDTLRDADDTVLEDHIYGNITFYHTLWNVTGTLEELDIEVSPGVDAQDVYRSRTVSGLEPGTTAKLNLTMNLNLGSVGTGLVFGVRFGAEEQYFEGAVGESELPIDVEMTAVVPGSGIVTFSYGAFATGDFVMPTGEEWDDGNYHWVFSVENVQVLSNCE